MPRPKVKPQDRQRSARACDACKASKKRCDGNQPCRLCLKKGTQDTCTYRPTARGRRSRHSESKSPQASSIAVATDASPAGFRSILTIPAQPPRAQVGDRSLASQDAEVDEVVDEDADSETDYVPDSRNSVERANQQRPLMLSSSSGDKVFVGNTAALSFLRFLQKTIKHYVGPSGFTDRRHSHNWFEMTGSDVDGGIFYDGLGENEKKGLINCFLDASSGFLDLYSQDELTELISLATEEQNANKSPASRPIDRAALASLYLMLAIGYQVRGGSRDDRMLASKYFNRGRQMAFEKMLEDPTINLARAFVLLAFYMFGACRRNSAFMYLGVAAKSADVLGLHTAAKHKHAPKAEQDSRLRVAKSIRVFDIICSSILGRRGSAPSLRCVDVTSGDIEQEHSVSCHRALALRATYESCSILETVVGKFADDGALESSSAEHFLQLLQEWSQVLPVSLRQRPQQGDKPLQDDPGYREKMIGNVHVAGTYYFGIILVTRQFLIQHVMPQLHCNASKEKERQRQNNRKGNNGADAVADLSRSCIGAAIYMAQMCREAVDAGVFMGNMCIIKAWIFAAGLVLGFALLANDSSDTGAREAFRGSQHVLSILGRLSAQARQYHRILSTFSDAIDNYKRQIRRERNESGIPFVEQILSYDFASAVSAQKQDNGVLDGVCERSAIVVDTGQGQSQIPLNGGTGMSQLPTPDFNVDDNPAAGEAGFWDGSDTLSSITMSEFLPEQWASPADNDLMLRILWDGYAMSFDDPL
ncbi:hypothetical protein J7T55_009699 [Diaporthe amygdali]|uniref:uncharacterized protein n=1 Tax=Phomopsis amygdali TaxID=1214568 RepID=UPI0022FF203C|nr:uncharacterized protein J7T55_009699 [Diaporthe amygdali]KAJ0104034.1 hypothetical protein J7T55_009699 [Diaporthe amygdali]